jgi:hypothetical protein
MNEQKFIPQAIVNQRTREVIHVFRNEEHWNNYWKGTVNTVDAPGVEPAHPSSINLGDTIDVYVTGWTRAKVESIQFVPDQEDLPGWHRSGYFHFRVSWGFIAVRINGRKTIDTIYIFP